MKEIRTEIIVNASKETVWNVLIDFESYPAWNPFIVKINGKPVEKTKLKAQLKLQDKKPMGIAPVVLEVIENQKFEWLGKMPLNFFNGQHYFIIESKGNNQVKFIQGEYFSGWLMKFVLSKVGAKTQEGFINMNRAIKVRAEKLQGQ